MSRDSTRGARRRTRATRGSGGGDGLRPLRKNRDYRLLWSGAWVSFLGSRVAQVTYPLLVLWATGSAAYAGIIAFAASAPNLVFQLPAGALVDRWDRKRVMVVCALGRFLVLGSVPPVLLAGTINLVHLVVVVFVDGSLTIFYTLAERAIIRQVVDRRQLPDALSQNEVRSRVAGLVGGPLGTSIFGLAKGVPFMVATLAHLISVLAIMRIRAKKPEARPPKPQQPALAAPAAQQKAPQKKPSLMSDIREGIVWLWRQKTLRIAILLYSITSALFPFISLGVPVILVVEEGRGPATVGAVSAVSSIGGIIGSAATNWLMKRFGIRPLFIGVHVSWFLLMVAMAFARTPMAIGAVFAGLNVVTALFGVVGAVYQMKVTPADMQGRAGATVGLLVLGATALGSLGAGFALQGLGSVHTIWAVSGVMLFLTVIAIVSPGLRAGARDPAFTVYAGRHRREERAEEMDTYLTQARTLRVPVSAESLTIPLKLPNLGAAHPFAPPPYIPNQHDPSDPNATRWDIPVMSPQQQPAEEKRVAGDPAPAKTTTRSDIPLPRRRPPGDMERT
ncbi:MFS transporter [Actinomadura terrae]|uniref:MFS transporter n=1 Tax=Actinomadura terrae TaxID=604353 RepID=UPI001FA6DBDB|nr:MFS transporter [Actinomadura terrae]